MTFDELQKGKAVTFYPLELYRIADGLPDEMRLLVYDIFILSNGSGKIPRSDLGILVGMCDIDRILATLIEMKILSEDEGGGLFLPLSTK